MEFFAPSSFFAEKLCGVLNGNTLTKKTALEIGAVFEFIALEAD